MYLTYALLSNYYQRFLLMTWKRENLFPIMSQSELIKVHDILNLLMCFFYLILDNY